VDLTVTVSSEAIAVVSTSATTLGAKTIVFQGVANTTVRTFFVQGLSKGTTTLTISAPGYTTVVRDVRVHPSAFIINSPGVINTTAGAANVNMTITSARLNPSTLAWAEGAGAGRAGRAGQRCRHEFQYGGRDDHDEPALVRSERRVAADAIRSTGGRRHDPVGGHAGRLRHVEQLPGDHGDRESVGRQGAARRDARHAQGAIIPPWRAGPGRVCLLHS
jgi:hypothetical protein